MPHDSHSRATFAQRRLIHQLRESNETGATALAALIDACRPTNPCHSAACPACGLAFQAVAVAIVDEFIGIPARAIRNRMTAITVVPTAGCIPPGLLASEDLKRVGTDITAALAALDLPPTIIGLEASFNEDTTGRFEDHWSVHSHGIQTDWLSSAREATLRAAFPPSRLVRKPVDCQPLDRRIEGRLYPFKPERVRRVTVLINSHPDRAPFRDSKRRELRPWQAVKLAIVEHGLGFSRRLLTHGINENVVRSRLEGLGWARDGP